MKTTDIGDNCSDIPNMGIQCHSEYHCNSVQSSNGLISLFFKGAEVFSVETVVTPLVPHMPTQTLPEITHWTPSSVANEYGMRKCLMQIR